MNILLIGLAWLLARILAEGLPHLWKWIRELLLLRRYNGIVQFNNAGLSIREFYVNRFGRIPSVTSLWQVDGGAAYQLLLREYPHLISDTYQNCTYDHEQGEPRFDITVLVLRNRMMMEIGATYVQFYFEVPLTKTADQLIRKTASYRLPQKKEDHEINIITLDATGLALKRLEIRPEQLDLQLFYNDDFLPVHELVIEKLSMEKGKGIVLLHGLPGTGKTTYLRHLICSLKKRILFVSPAVAGNLMNPEFIDLLVDNPDSVLIIEDAENILLDRKQQRNASVSNLLNLSDGLLSDCLNVQIICTFNSSLNMVDTAFLRKGRLIAQYEFGKLTAGKAARLSTHLGYNSDIQKPMTIAEIAGQDDPEFDKSVVAPIGFTWNEQVAN